MNSVCFVVERTTYIDTNKFVLVLVDKRLFPSLIFKIHDVDFE